MAEPPIERQLEVVAPPLEVLVELAPRLVEPGGILEHPRRQLCREACEHLVEALVRKRDPHQSPRGRRDRGLAERRVQRRVGDVQQAVLVGPRHQSVDELAHLAISFSSAALARSFLSASCTLWRAASSDVPIASPTSR